MLKQLLKIVTARTLVRGILVGVGGGVLSAIGWRIGTDIYQALKKRLQEDAAPSQVEAEGDGQGQGRAEVEG